MAFLVTRTALLTTGALTLALWALPAAAQDLQDRPVAPPPPSETPLPTSDDQVQFSAGELEYQMDEDIVIATGDVRMYRRGDRLRANRIRWNRKTGQVLDVSDESKDVGAPVIQWEDNGFDNQRWSWVGKGAERRLKSKSSGLVADTDKDGKLVQRKADEAAKTQLWKVVPVGK